MQPKGQVSSIAVPASAAPQDASPPDSAAIRNQLDRLLTSAHFRNSKRCQALLKYVVEAHLEGAVDRVRERTIGCEVFHRDAGYDTNQDSVVRTTAAEVRKRLAQYYLEPGREEELRLALPAGSYIPEFRHAPPSDPLLRVAIDPVAPTPSKTAWRFWPVAAAIVAAVCALWWWQSRIPAIDRFWNPVIGDRADAILCIEQPLKIYRIDGPRFEELTEKMVGGPNTPPAPPEVLDRTELKLSDLRPAGNQYFSFGDLMVSTRLSEFLARHQKSFQVLGDRAATYRDLRGKPAVLIGQFNNRWTLDLTGGLRYYLERDAARHIYEIRDRQNRGSVVASASKSADRPDEYAIVSRILNPSTEKTVLTVTGMTQQGTIAGGDFLTNATYMQEAFRNAPTGWYRKNIQVVIRTAMMGGIAGPPKVIATYFW